jgi:hypothetical protein
MAEYRARIHRVIETFPAPGKHGDWQITLNKLVCSYLVHQGFAATAEAFSRATGRVRHYHITIDRFTKSHFVKINTYFYSGKKYPNYSCYFCNFHKNTQGNKSPNARFRPIWPPCLSVSLFLPFFQDVSEDWKSIRNRQKIQKLVLQGKVGDAISLTEKLYPGFLQVN